MGVSPFETYDFVKTIVDGPVSFGLAGWFMAKTFLKAFETKDKQLFDSLTEETKACNDRYIKLFEAYRDLGHRVNGLSREVRENKEVIRDVQQGAH